MELRNILLDQERFRRDIYIFTFSQYTNTGPLWISVEVSAHRKYSVTFFLINSIGRNVGPTVDCKICLENKDMFPITREWNV